MTRRLILDLSRMLSRAPHPVPTGIDRVELAYAEGLLERVPDRLEFGAMHPIGQFAILSRAGSRRFLEAAARRWRGHAFHPALGNGAAGEPSTGAVQSMARRLQHSILLRSQLPGPRRLLGHGPGSTYLNVSHHHLDRPAVIGAVKERNRAVFVPLLHDVIPIEYPEYSRPGEPARHRRRVETLARLSDGVVVNSAATGRALRPWLDAAGRDAPVLVAPLGVDPPPPGPSPDLPGEYEGRPFFVVIGTIEPRKNHLLLLQVWRRLAERLGPAAPRLVVIGRRGWENEQVLDMLERCPSLHGLVEERNALSDAEARALVLRARAVLTPSFAEGYGLPLAEGLAAGVPVLCSDIPPHRDVGGDAPEYLDPIDGLGWAQAILDYARPDSPRRAAQLARLGDWAVPSWDEHMRQVLDFVDHGIG